eukprot:scaffold670171_cov34-Prasinocladus_malaysianus.AAC.1
MSSVDSEELESKDMTLYLLLVGVVLAPAFKRAFTVSGQADRAAQCRGVSSTASKASTHAP